YERPGLRSAGRRLRREPSGWAAPPLARKGFQQPMAIGRLPREIRLDTRIYSLLRILLLNWCGLRRTTRNEEERWRKNQERRGATHGESCSTTSAGARWSSGGSRRPAT